MILLAIENLYAGYGAADILSDINLFVAQGEIVTVIGSNGAGKSTLMKCISGLVRSRQGSILFKNEPIEKLSVDTIARLGLIHVPEDRRLFPGLTVYENLVVGSSLPMDNSQFKEDLDRVTTIFPILKQRLKQLAWSLSGGEQQMLAIARGLAHPKLLILDEPSLGLAPVIQEKVFESFCAIREMGTAVLLVEQNAYMALNTADRGYVLSLGEITLSGSTKELVNNEMVKESYLGK
mgnify:CR=1 FL=1